MSLRITRAQRDAIYWTVITRLTGIGDVWSMVQQRDFAAAKQLGREFAEDLRLLEDLGWSETIDTETVTLTVPVDELARAVVRLQRYVSGPLEAYVRQLRDAEEIVERALVASQVFAQLLVQLVGQGQGIARGRAELPAGDPMTAAKRSAPDAVLDALATQGDRTAAEIAPAAGIGRSTAGKALATLEQAGKVRRAAGGREGASRLPDRWSSAAADEPSVPSLGEADVPASDSPAQHVTADGSADEGAEQDAAAADARTVAEAGGRLRPGQLDGLVRGYLTAHADEVPRWVPARSPRRSGAHRARSATASHGWRPPGKSVCCRSIRAATARPQKRAQTGIEISPGKDNHRQGYPRFRARAGKGVDGGRCALCQQSGCPDRRSLCGLV